MDIGELVNGEHIVIHAAPEDAPLNIWEWCKQVMPEYLDNRMNVPVRMEQLRVLMHWLGVDYE